MKLMWRVSVILCGFSILFLLVCWGAVVVVVSRGVLQPFDLHYRSPAVLRRCQRRWEAAGLDSEIVLGEIQWRRKGGQEMGTLLHTGSALNSNNPVAAHEPHCLRRSFRRFNPLCLFHAEAWAFLRSSRGVELLLFHQAPHAEAFFSVVFIFGIFVFLPSPVSLFHKF